jgi:hypothetical protein
MVVATAKHEVQPSSAWSLPSSGAAGDGCDCFRCRLRERPRERTGGILLSDWSAGSIDVLGGEGPPEEPRAEGAPGKSGERLVMAAQKLAAVGRDEVQESCFALGVAKGRRA